MVLHRALTLTPINTFGMNWKTYFTQYLTNFHNHAPKSCEKLSQKSGPYTFGHIEYHHAISMLQYDSSAEKLEEIHFPELPLSVSPFPELL